MADDVLKRLEKHTIKGRKRVNGRHHYCHTCDVIDEIKRLLAERDAERALADQLADALRAVLHDRPSAHTDNVWAAINQALITYEEARRG